MYKIELKPCNYMILMKKHYADSGLSFANKPIVWANMRILGFANKPTVWDNLRMLGKPQLPEKIQVPALKRRDALAFYVENLQAEGRLSFTSEEAVQALKESKSAFTKAALRLIQKGKLLRPVTGFYVIVPAEYRNAKSVPPEWYIDALMKFYSEDYYVGGLSAAALFGAAHQAPQELQVFASRPLRMIEFNRTRIRFFTKNDVSSTPIQKSKNQVGYFNVSTPESTALDLVRYYKATGYFNNIATVLAELSERIDSKKLVLAAEASNELSIVQRLGYLLEVYGDKKLIEPLLKWISEQKTKFVPLRSGWDGKVLNRNEQWRVLVNDLVEPDL